MTIKSNIHSKTSLYEGHSQLYKYELQVSSQQNEQKQARIIKREILHTYDAVVVLIYAKDIDAFVLCKEFRPGVFLNQSNDDAYIYQCVAGMIDQQMSPEAVARKEAKEEAGLILDHLQLIATVYSSPGHMTEKIYFYYTEMRGMPTTGTFGVEAEGEEITTHLIKRDEVYKMMDDNKIIDAMTLLALNWFKAHKN